MLSEKTIAVVVPAYNEQDKIVNVLETIPDFIDRVYVINDSSTDDTPANVSTYAKQDKRIELITLPHNQGVGAAIVNGYKECIKNKYDIAVVMAGDGQMCPDDLPHLLHPIISNQADYVKGNRFIHTEQGLKSIPFIRAFGNMGLTILTKVASGYWHISDTQSGYTAINAKALAAIDWDKCYPRYGCPNDYLVKLNIANMRVMDIPVKAIYGPKWASKMNVKKIILPMVGLLLRLFGERMFRKYVVKEGHPLVLFYLFSSLSLFCSLLLFFYICISFFINGRLPQTAIILWGISLTMGLHTMLQGFEMDYRTNEHLYKYPDNES